MSLLPRRGTCFHCGHDHGEGLGDPRILELTRQHAEDIKWRDDLIAELRAKLGEQPSDELTHEQITAGAAVLGDDGKPIGRNTAIMVADAMRIGQPADERKDADESDRLFMLIAEIRAACGDNGQRTQDDLVAHIAAQAKHADTYLWLRENWFRIYGQNSGDAGIRIDLGKPWNSSGRPDHVDAAIERCRALAEKGERNE